MHEFSSGSARSEVQYFLTCPTSGASEYLLTACPLWIFAGGLLCSPTLELLVGDRSLIFLSSLEPAEIGGRRARRSGVCS